MHLVSERSFLRLSRSVSTLNPAELALPALHEPSSSSSAEIRQALFLLFV